MAEGPDAPVLCQAGYHPGSVAVGEVRERPGSSFDVGDACRPGLERLGGLGQRDAFLGAQGPEVDRLDGGGVEQDVVDLPGDGPFEAPSRTAPVPGLATGPSVPAACTEIDAIHPLQRARRACQMVLCKPYREERSRIMTMTNEKQQPGGDRRARIWSSS